MTAVRDDEAAVIVCRPTCLSCGSTHELRFVAQPVDRVRGTPENDAIKARVVSGIAAHLCGCGLTMGETLDLERRRAAGTLS